MQHFHVFVADFVLGGSWLYTHAMHGILIHLKHIEGDPAIVRDTSLFLKVRDSQFEVENV
jgi:hypothetical protein